MIKVLYYIRLLLKEKEIIFLMLLLEILCWFMLMICLEGICQGKKYLVNFFKLIVRENSVRLSFWYRLWDILIMEKNKILIEKDLYLLCKSSLMMMILLFLLHIFGTYLKYRLIRRWLSGKIYLQVYLYQLWGVETSMLTK